MANEITISVSIAVSKNGLSEDLAFTGNLVTLTGSNWMKNIQSVGTSEEAILLGDVGTPGFMIVKNLDATNFVSIRSGTGAANTVKIKAGEVALFRHSGSAPFAIADTGACRIQYLLLEN